MYPLVKKIIIVMYLDWKNRFFKKLFPSSTNHWCVFRFILKGILIRSKKKGQIDKKNIFVLARTIGEKT
jgi:hypothetical protein